MTRTITEFMKEILEYHGSIVDQMEDGSLEAIIPAEISGILNIPEHARFSFSYNPDQGERIYASYDSEIFKSITTLLGEKGRYSCATIETLVPNPGKISNIVQNRICFNNAVYRVEKSEVGKMPYLLLIFKYTALSDEKQEGITSVLINKESLSVTIPRNDLDDILEILRETDDRTEIQNPET